MKDKSAFNVTSYIVVIALSLIFLYAGNRIAVRDAAHVDSTMRFYEARVTRVLDVETRDLAASQWRIFTLEAEIRRGSHRGEIVTFSQNISDNPMDLSPRQAWDGDRVLLSFSEHGEWGYIDHVRIYTVLILGGVFVVLLVLFGRGKGFNSILSLGFTCAAIFAVFIPLIMAGRSIYLSSIVVCMFSIAVTLFLVKGVNKRSGAAFAGCVGGVVVAGFLTYITSRFLGFTGVTQEGSRHLLVIFGAEFDLHAVIFAGIIIGAVGAITDMAVSISSHLWELRTNAPEMATSPSGIFLSGINVGKDIMGSSINTLVLAYIGSSLTIILVLVGQDTSLFRLINRELIIVDLLKAIVGVFGIFLTMPLTAGMCAVLYTRAGRFAKR